MQLAIPCKPDPKTHTIQVDRKEVDEAYLKTMDAFIIGYPKTGNTWIQIIVRKALVDYYHLPVDQMSQILGSDPGMPALKYDPKEPWKVIVTSNLPENVKRVYITHAVDNLNTSTCRDMNLNLNLYLGRKIIMPIRNPGDTIVSLYMHNRHRCVPPLYEGTADEMMYDSIFGIDKYVSYYNIWLSQYPYPEDILWVKYEDLFTNTHEIINSMLRFIGMEDISEGFINGVLQYASFENMLKMETEGALNISAMHKPPTEDPNSRKVRSGGIGKYVTHLSPATIAFMNGKIRTELRPELGYSN